MKKITKRALSMTVSGLLLMNTFTATVFADNNHEEFENNGHGYGHEWNKDWFENGHDNGHHGHKNDQGQEEEFVIEDLDQEEPVEEQISEEEQSEQPAEEQQVEETEQNEESQQEEQTEETEQGEELQQEEQTEETGQSEELQQEEEIAEEESSEDEISEENVEPEAEETSEEEVSEDPSSVVENSAEAVQEALNEAEEDAEEETEEEVEEAVEEEAEEPEEAPWESYTLYNYISLNEGTTYISLNTQENGITAPKPAAEFHKENNNKRYDLSEDEYEIEDYDLTELVITSNGIRFVEQSAAKDGQAYFIARLDRVEAVAAAPFRASSCVEDIESFTSLGSKVITFHRNWYLTLVTPEIQMVSGQKLLTGVKMPDNKYYGIDYTDNFKAVDSRMVAYGAKLSEDQYEIEDYDFTNLTLTYKNVEYAYRPDGPVAGDGNGFHYYTVKLLKLDKVNKSTYGGGYLIEDWPEWPLTNAKAADPDGFPYTAGYYHRDYTVTLHVGDAPAAPVEEITPVVEEETPVIEEVEPVEEEVTPVIEEVEPVEEEQIVEEEVAPAEEEQIIEEEVAPVEEEQIVEEEVAPAEEEQIVEEEVAPAEEEQIVEEETTPAEEEQIVEEEVAPSIIEEAAAAVDAIKAIIEETVEEAEEVPAAVVEEAVEEAAEVSAEIAEEAVEEAVEAPAAVIEVVVEEVEKVPAAVVEETVEEAEEVPAAVVEETVEEAEEVLAAVVEETVEEAEEVPAAVVEETVEEAEEVPAAVVEETRKPRRQQNHDEILAFTEPVVASDSTANVETQIIEDAEMPMTTYMAAVEAEEILEEELPMAAAPFEAVTVADNTEAVQAAVTEEVSGTETEEPTFVAVASMQVADFVKMTETEAPQAAAGTWSLASLIFTCMTILLAVFSLASKTASRKIKALAAVIAAASAAIFLLTSDLSGMMITADRWTLAIIILNIFEAVFASTATNEVRRG